MIGAELTVIVSILSQPLKLVKVTTAVPAEIPVTMPVDVTVATATFEDIHGFKAAGAILLDNVVVNPSQTFKLPEIIASASTVMIWVFVQPLDDVKVIVVVPEVIPVISPVKFTVATEVSDEIHGLTAAGAAVLDSVVVRPSQTLNIPLIIGEAFTVTFAVVVQPVAAVKVIVALPKPTPVTVPVELTVATATFEEIHGLTTAGVSVLDKIVVCPAQTESVPEITGVGFTIICPVKTVLFPQNPTACTE